MEENSLSDRIIRFLYRKETIVFIITYLIIWNFIYQMGFKFNGPNDITEKSASLSGFIAFFPAGIISGMVVFFLSSRTSGWLKPMMQLVVLIAKADGKISNKEKKAIEKNLNNQFGLFRIKKAIRYFEEFENKNNLSVSKSCMLLKKHFHASEMTLFLDFLVSVAVSDQYLSRKEEDLLNEICRRLTISPKLLISILSRKNYISENKREQESKQSFKSRYSTFHKYYKTLGLPENSSFEEVKKAYRSLAKQYHPDKIRDKTLKENAKRQFQEITEAYNAIKDKVG